MTSQLAPHPMQGDKNDAGLTVNVKRVETAKSLPLPKYATASSAGMDLQAAIEEAVELAPHERTMVPTGLAIALPEGYEAQIRPRSGLAAKHGVTVLNSPGTIDADYRGEIKVILINHSQDVFTIEPGMRIAQMVIAPYTQANLCEVTDLEETTRGAGGFGSTGTA